MSDQVHPKRHKVSIRTAGVIVLALIVGLLAAQVGGTKSADAVMVSSSNVALVPGPCGAFGGAGCMPTSGFSGGYAPSFTNVAIASLPSVINNYDTVVLLQICNIGTWLGDSSWRDALHNWVQAGGKLIIYDSDACGTLTLDYSNFVFPFTTNNPCQCGSNQGTLEIVEDNTLSSTDPSSPFYIDVAPIEQNTDAVGDASVMLTQDSHWKGDMRARNTLGFEGFTHTYAEHGSGLIIYDGLDSDNISISSGLQKIWELELKQQWDPSDLPGGVPVAGGQRKIVLVPGIAFDVGEEFDPPQNRAIATFECLMDFISGDVDVGDLNGDGASDECPADVTQDSDLLSELAIDRSTDFYFFSYGGLDASYSGRDTWQRLQTSAEIFDLQFNAWRNDCNTCTFDIITHSLGGVVVAYWLQNVADSEDVGAIHAVLSLSSPLRGLRLAQLAVCAIGYPFDWVVRDFCPDIIDGKVVPGLNKVPTLVLNNADDGITNGCLLLGAATGNTGIWAADVPRLGPGVGLPVVGCAAQLALRIRRLVDTGNVQPLASLMGNYAEAHSKTLKDEEAFRPWVRRTLLNDFYDNQRLDCVDWSTRIKEDISLGQDAYTNNDGRTCSLTFASEAATPLLLFTSTGRGQAALEVDLDQFATVEINMHVSLGFNHDRQAITIPVSPAFDGEHSLTLTSASTRICIPKIIFGRCPRLEIRESHIDGIELDRIGVTSP